MFNEVKLSTYAAHSFSKEDSIKVSQKKLPTIINSDSIFETYTLAEKSEVYKNAYTVTNKLAGEWSVKSIQMTDTDKNILRHKIDWHKKITLSLSCLMFFFIGAPLGAIIRKGGIGLPVVISVIIFVLYYIIDSGSTRVARSGEMNIILGVWMSTLVLTPIGVFFTYKSNKDSVVFNLEVYLNIFRWLLGLRPSRHMTKKEVIIEDPNYKLVYCDMTQLSEQCNVYLQESRLTTAPNYFQIFTSQGQDNKVAEFSEQLESLIEELSNSKDHVILKALNNYPILSTHAHKKPFSQRWMNVFSGIIIPLGLFFYFRIWFFRLRLDKDLKNIIQTNTLITERIKNQSLDI